MCFSEALEQAGLLLLWSTRNTPAHIQAEPMIVASTIQDYLEKLLSAVYSDLHSWVGSFVKTVKSVEFIGPVFFTKVLNIFSICSVLNKRSISRAGIYVRCHTKSPIRHLCSLFLLTNHVCDFLLRYKSSLFFFQLSVFKAWIHCSIGFSVHKQMGLGLFVPTGLFGPIKILCIKEIWSYVHQQLKKKKKNQMDD